jgi:hypothetical protein
MGLWKMLLALLPASLLAGCGGNCAGGPGGSWTWLIGFRGMVRNAADSSGIPGASVLINGSYRAVTDDAGRYDIKEKSCDEDPSSGMRTISVAVSRAGFRAARKDIPSDSLRPEQIGNEDTSDGKRWTIPDIFLSK